MPNAEPKPILPIEHTLQAMKLTDGYVLRDCGDYVMVDVKTGAGPALLKKPRREE